MLVGTLEIEIGGPLQRRPAPALEREDMGAAGIEPDVENVADHLVVARRVIGAEQLGFRRLVPAVDTGFADGGDDARVDRGIAQIIIAALLDEQRDWHPPGALARQHPVGGHSEPLPLREGVGDGCSASADVGPPTPGPSPEGRGEERCRSIGTNHCGVQR